MRTHPYHMKTAATTFIWRKEKVTKQKQIKYCAGQSPELDMGDKLCVNPSLMKIGKFIPIEHD